MAVTTMFVNPQIGTGFPMRTKPGIRRALTLVIAFACHGWAAADELAKSTTLLSWNSPLAEPGGPNLDEPLVTDRPDFTEASSTVGRGVLQIESGYTFSFDDDEGDETRSHSYPETLWKLGVFADWLELRFVYNYGDEDFNGIIATGSEDLNLGTKLSLTGQAGILPQTAIILQMTIPTGDDSFSADEALPGINYIYSWTINDFVSMAGSTQANRVIEALPETAYAEFAQSWTFGYSLTEKLGAYTEWFVLVPHSAEHARNEYYFDGGFTYYITDNVMWDIRAGVGLDEDADDFFAGSGLSLRFK
jgi:hypothetical protein